MKALILYKPNSEHDSSVQEYVENFRHDTNKDIELLDSESVQGAEIARLYDILQIPAIVAFEDDGSIIQTWTERDKWPTSAELTFYF